MWGYGRHAGNDGGEELTGVAPSHIQLKHSHTVKTGGIIKKIMYKEVGYSRVVDNWTGGVLLFKISLTIKIWLLCVYVLLLHYHSI